MYLFITSRSNVAEALTQSSGFGEMSALDLINGVDTTQGLTPLKSSRLTRNGVKGLYAGEEGLENSFHNCFMEGTLSFILFSNMFFLPSYSANLIPTGPSTKLNVQPTI